MYRWGIQILWQLKIFLDIGRTRAVWPDVEIQSYPSFSKSCPKRSHCSFYQRFILFTSTQKVIINFGYFLEKLFNQNLKKSPNLVTLNIITRWENIWAKPKQTTKRPKLSVKAFLKYQIYPKEITQNQSDALERCSIPIIL